MEAKELRINNFIRLKENGNIFDVKVVGTRCEAIDVYNNGVYTSYFKNIDDYLEPIPLTEEWLLKFGFVIHNKPNGYTEYIKYKEGTKQYLHKLFTFKESDNDWDGKFAFSGTIQTKLKHVNQLQNLYFALTGEELTIKK